MQLIPEIQFKEIKEDTNEKERQRKEKDQERWRNFFSRSIIEYFEEHDFESYHREFDPVRDKLDCFVPAAGTYICGEQAKAGSKKRKKKKKDNTETPDVTEKSKKDEKQGMGCGRHWNSNLCLTKFVCFVKTVDKKNILIVQLREYGQRCSHCRKRYENPSFSDHDQGIMMDWLLTMILEGMFNVVDPDIVVNPDDLSFFRRRPKQTNQTNGKSHNSEICQPCIEGKQCGRKRKERKKKKRADRR